MLERQVGGGARRRRQQSGEEGGLEEWEAVEGWERAGRGP